MKSRNSYLRGEDMSEKSKDTLDEVVAVISKILEGILFSITVYISKKE